MRKAKPRQFKTTEEFLKQLDADVARWTAVSGANSDRLYASGIDHMFEMFGYPLRIGDAPPYPTLLQMYEEALAKGQQPLSLLLAECLRTVGRDRHQEPR